MKLICTLLLVIASASYAQAAELAKTVQPYDSLDIEGTFKTTITSGDETKIVFTGPQKLLDRLLLEENGNELSISIKSRFFGLFDDNDGDIELEIHQSALKDLKMSGASSISGKISTTDSLDLSLLGASKGDLEVNLKNFKIDLTGASRLKVFGLAKVVEISTVGACQVAGSALKTEVADVSAIGASKVSIHVAKMLDANSVGASHISYTGDPKVSQSSVGASSVSKI